MGCQNIPLIFISLSLNAKDDQISELSLPELGDRVSGAVSAAQERAIGEMFLEQIYSVIAII